MVFCFGSLSLISSQRQSRATGSSNVVGTDGENAVLLAKFGRSDRKQFSSTWLACKTSLLIQVVAGSSLIVFFADLFVMSIFLLCPHSPPAPPTASAATPSHPRGGRMNTIGGKKYIEIDRLLRENTFRDCPEDRLLLCHGVTIDCSAVKVDKFAFV